jgi:flagellar protein FlbD
MLTASRCVERQCAKSAAAKDEYRRCAPNTPSGRRGIAGRAGGRLDSQERGQTADIAIREIVTGGNWCLPTEEDVTSMIRLTRLNNRPLVVNSELIKFIENAPDTVITLVSGEKIVVLETADDVISRIVEYRQRLRGPIVAGPALPKAADQMERSEEPVSIDDFKALPEEDE